MMEPMISDPKLFRYLVEASTDGIWLLDGEGRTLWSNACMADLLGRTPEEMATLTLPNAVQGILETPAHQDVVIPELAPISVRSRDELQTVATAINHVQSSALDLAVEQATLRRNIADSFVSLRWPGWRG